MRNNKIIGVVGAGVMGKGVAQRFAQYGFCLLYTSDAADER